MSEVIPPFPLYTFMLGAGTIFYNTYFIIPKTYFLPIVFLFKLNKFEMQYIILEMGAAIPGARSHWQLNFVR
jgi:hypothetical protein